MSRALVTRSGPSKLPSALLTLLLVLAGVAAWVGVDGAPYGSPSGLGAFLSATEEAGTAKLVETSGQVDLGAQSPHVARGPSVFDAVQRGTVDFSADELALRTRVIQPGVPSSRTMTYIAPGALFERQSPARDAPYSPWTEQAIAYDPLVSIPGFAELQQEPASVRLRPLGSRMIRGLSFRGFEIGPSEALCTVPDGFDERLDTLTRLWVDGHGVIRLVSTTETVSVHLRSNGALHATFTPSHFRTMTKVTFSDFGTPMAFARPRNAHQLLEGSGPSATVARKPSCRPLKTG